MWCHSTIVSPGLNVSKSPKGVPFQGIRHYETVSGLYGEIFLTRSGRVNSSNKPGPAQVGAISKAQN